MIRNVILEYTVDCEELGSTCSVRLDEKVLALLKDMYILYFQCSAQIILSIILSFTFSRIVKIICFSLILFVRFCKFQ